MHNEFLWGETAWKMSNRKRKERGSWEGRLLANYRHVILAV